MPFEESKVDAALLQAILPEGWHLGEWIGLDIDQHYMDITIKSQTGRQVLFKCISEQKISGELYDRMYREVLTLCIEYMLRSRHSDWKFFNGFAIKTEQSE